MLRPGHGHLHIVVAPQAVANDDLAAGGQRRKAVLKCRVQMLQRILPPTGIQGVAVGQEGHAAQALDHIGNHLGIVGPQEGQVARLSKVHLDGHQLVVKIDLPNPGGADQLFQLVEQVLARTAAQVRVINLCLFHRCHIPPGLHCNVDSTYFIPVSLEPQVLFLHTSFGPPRIERPFPLSFIPAAFSHYVTENPTVFLLLFPAVWKSLWICGQVCTASLSHFKFYVNYLSLF